MTAFCPTAAVRAFSKISLTSTSAHPFGGAEDALRSHQQDHDEDEQGADVLEVGGDQQRADVDEPPDDEGAQEGAVGGAQPAEGDAGEHEEQELEAEAG